MPSRARPPILTPINHLSFVGRIKGDQLSSNSSSGRFARLAAESVVVIFSIMVAFALDAWWDRHVASRDLADELTAVVSEIDLNLERLDLQLRLHRDAVSSIDALVSVVDGAEGRSVTVPDTLLNRAVSFSPTFDPSTGALDALVSGGWLSQIEQPELRLRLSAMPSRFTDLQEEEVQAREVAHGSILPLLWDQASLRAALYSGRVYYDRGLANTALPSRPVEIRVPAGLGNRLVFRRAWLAAAVAELESLRGDLVETRVLVADYVR